jgi:hypothetical protein
MRTGQGLRAKKSPRNLSFFFGNGKNSRRGQMVAAEYVVVIFIVLGAIAIMTVYMKRTIQARAHDAQRMALKSAAVGLNKSVLVEYEPYYVNQYTMTDQDVVDNTRIVPTGDYLKETNTLRSVTVESTQLPPDMAH